MTAPQAERAKALVVVESMFGNTAQVGTAVAAGWPAGLDAEVLGVEIAPTGCRTTWPAGGRRADPRLLDEPAEHPR